MTGFLKRLFGGGGKQPAKDPLERAPDAVHKGIEIRTNPMADSSGQFRVAGYLTKPGDPALTRQFVRADLLPTKDQAADAALSKAQMIIDQNGEGLWKGDLSHPA